MDLLLKKENILYESVMNKQNDRDSLSAFHDYITFLSTEGVLILTHLNTEVAERDKEQKKIQDLLENILSKVKKSTFELEKIIIQLKLEGDDVFKERLQSLKNFLNGNVVPLSSDPLGNFNMDYNNILRRLDDLGYRKEILDYIILSSGSVSDIKDAVAFEDKKKYYQLKNAFIKKHSLSTAGSLINLIKILADINIPESRTEHKRISYISDVEKVHNSILLNSLDKQAESKVVFYMEGDEIHHYKKGKLIYEKVGLRDPIYIQMFKNIIRYMPANESKVRIRNFESYGQSNTFSVVGNSNGNLNGEVNRLFANSGYKVRLYNNKPTASSTFAYESDLAPSDIFNFSNIACGEYWVRLEDQNGGIKSQSKLVSVRCDGTSFTIISYIDFGACDPSTAKIPVLLVPGILGSTATGTLGAFSKLPPNPPRWDSGELENHNFIVGDLPGFRPLVADVVGWETIKEDLESNGYTRDCDIFEAPYYWANSAESSARDYLKPWIDHALETSGKQKVDIIAHSMGGIVTRSYVQSDYYDADINKFAMVGTPNQGAPFAYLVWEDGDTIQADEFASISNPDMLAPGKYSYTNNLINFMRVKWGIEACDIKTQIGFPTLQPRIPSNCNNELIKSFVQNHVIGVRDLLPTNSESITNLTGQSIGYDKNEDLVILNNGDLSIYDTMTLGLFAGNTKLTLNSLRVNNAGNSVYSLISNGGSEPNGDGTVPLVSMHFSGLANATNTFFGDGYHAELPNIFDTTLLGFILN